MSIQKSTTNKSYAAWLIIALHVSLGVGLYYQHTQTNNSKVARVQHAPAPAPVVEP